MTAIKLGPTVGVHHPDYDLRLFHNGNPAKRIRGVDWRSAIAIQTSKNMNDVAGTFTITMKDPRARRHVKAMDAGTIRLRGHYRNGMTTVLRVVVDEVRAGRTSDPYASQQDTVITGRCTGKYLQVTSLFLPVWDPNALLPTALTFGYGDVTKKVGTRPYDINRYLVRRFTYGVGTAVGLSAIPNSRHWIDYHSRFSRTVGVDVPFLQFDENSVAEAFKRLEVLGFTETWLDELGRQVYRRPQWDAPVSYTVSTDELRTDQLAVGDLEIATYMEVIPAGDPGIDSATAQALRAGRAPVPSSYLAGADTSLSGSVDPGFVIDTDRKGEPTAEGKRNKWYRLQRRYGLRPQQISSPLIFSQEQAQKQAEGLLRFYSRMTKGINATLPGCPELRLGRNIRVHGRLDGERIDRCFYIEQISHDYVHGEGYTTSFVGTHGRDPDDPQWSTMVLPRFQPTDLADSNGGGVMDPGGSGGKPVSDADLDAFLKTRPTPKQIIDRVVLPVGRKHSLKAANGGALTAANVEASNATHGKTTGGNRSDHQGPPEQAWAADMSNGWLTVQEHATASTLAKMFGIPWKGTGISSATVGAYSAQLIYGIDLGQAAGGDHRNHVHFGIHRAT